MSDFLPPVVLRLAADISEYTEKLALASAQLEAFTQGAGQRLEGATSRFREEGERAGRGFGDGVPAGTRDTAERVTRDVTGRLRDHRGRFVAEGEGHGRGIGDGVSGGLRGALSSVTSALGTLGSSIGSSLGAAGKVASGSLSVLSATAFPMLIAAALQTVPALATVGGALAGSLPAAGAVAGGMLATLMLGFHGLSGAIGAAFAPAAAGGAAAMGQVANAEWALKQAQQSAIQTQQALNQARVAAVQNIKDLALAMSGAKLHVEEAELAVKDADLAWRAAFATGNQDQIQRTDLALRQAQQGLAEAQNGASKTAAQKEDSDKRGVEGSQGVQSALQAQEQAVHALAQAQEALAQAQKGSGGAASALSTAMAKLAPSAQAVVMEIVKLKPALHDIQQTVQQHMFAGLGEDLGNLAHSWLPGAKAGLTGMSDQFNLMFRGIAQGMATPAFSGALAKVFASFTGVLHQFAELAPKGVSAFGSLISAATPFLAALGGGAAKGLGGVLDWINKLAANGGLDKFFATATELLKPLGGLLKDLGTILGAVFTAIGSAGGPALGVLGELVHTLAEFFKSAAGGQALAVLFQTIAPLLSLVGSVISQLLPIVGSLIAVLGPALQPIIAALGPLLQPIIALVGVIGDALGPVIRALAPALTAVMVALTPVLGMLGGAFGDIIMALAPIIAVLARVIGDILVQQVTMLTPVFQKLLPVIVLLVQAVLPALIPLIQLVGQLFSALMPILTPLINLLVDILVPILKLLAPVLGLLTPIIELVAKALLWIITPIADFIGWLVAGLDKASTWKAIGKWFSGLWDTISGAFTKGVKWVGEKWGEFMGFITGLPGRILKSIGDLGSLLMNTGKDVVRGLWDGLLSMEKWMIDKVMGWVKRIIPGPILDALGVKSPSTVAAAISKWVPVGLAKGMDDNAHHVVAASLRMADAMLPDVGDLRLPTFSGGDGASLVVPSRMSGTAGGSAAPLPPIQLTIPIEIGGKTMQILHLELIPYAQRYKARTGSTGLS